MEGPDCVVRASRPDFPLGTGVQFGSALLEETNEHKRGGRLFLPCLLLQRDFTTIADYLTVSDTVHLISILFYDDCFIFPLQKL